MSYKWTGTGSYLDGTFGTALDFNFTFACMAYFETAWGGTIRTVATLANANSATDNNTIQLRESSVSNTLFARATDSAGTGYNAADGGNASTGTWIPVVVTVVKGSSNQTVDRNIYVVSYANAANETTDLTFAGTLGYLRLGDNFVGDRDWFTTGNPRYLAEVAVWSSVLSQTDIENYLAKKRVSDGTNGISTSTLRAYFPLLNNLNKAQGADSISSLSSTGSVASDAAHPTITEWTTKYLKVLTHPSAVSASGVAGVVFNAPTGGAITGTEIGEFTGKTFEASTENNQAVLKVPVADFGGTSLTTADSPAVLVRNTTHTTGIVTAEIIEE